MFVMGKLSSVVATVCLILSHGVSAQEIEIPNAVEESQITDMRKSKIVLSTWGQGSLPNSENPFYNYSITEKFGIKANTGCAATSLGQVMKYHNYPSFEVPGFSEQCVLTRRIFSAPDVVDSVNSITNDVESFSDPRLYSFDKMQINPTSSDSPEFISPLLYDIAVSLSSEFAVNEDLEGNDFGISEGENTRDTKSDVKKIAKVLREKFSYSNAVMYAEWKSTYKSAFEDQEMMGKMICANLDANQPVIIVYGEDSVKNHVAIVDGYGYVADVKTPYYHINFALGGAADGWYQLPKFKPLQNTIEGSEFQCCYIGSGEKKINAIVFNISPETDGEIVSGRAGFEVVDEELSTDTNTVYKISPIEDVEVKIFDPADLYNHYAETLTTNGIFALRSNFDAATNLVLEAHYTDIVEGPLVAEKRIEINKNVVDYNYDILSKDGIGNLFGVELALKKPKAIVDGIGYASLERAIAAAQTSPESLPEVKIVDAIDFNCIDWTITRDMVISSTNSNPRLTPVMRKGSGFLRIAEGANVVLSNVCFQALGDEYPVVEVSTNAVCTLAGIADVEVIRVLNGGLIDISPSVDESCSFKVDTSDVAEGMHFAISDKTASESDKFANLFIHLTDESLCGLSTNAVAGGSVVQWANRPIPDSAAVLKLEQNGVAVNYRSFGSLLKDIESASIITVIKDCDFTNKFEVVHDLTVRSATGRGIVKLSGGKDELIVKNGAQLKFEDVVLTGHVGGCLITVEENSSLVVAEGAVLSNIVNKTTRYGGAVYVKNSGVAKILPDAVISSVTNSCSNSYGGFMCLAPNALAEIAGGTIEGCSARNGNGGAIYVAPGAKLSVSGPAFISGNTKSSANTPSDIFISDSSSLVLAQVFEEDCRFGVSLPTGENATDVKFASVEVQNATQDDIKKIAKRFFNNVNADLYGTVAQDDGKFFLIWTKDSQVVHTPLDEMHYDQAAVRVVYNDTQITQMWERLDWALNSIDADATVTLIKDGKIEEKVYIADNIVICSEGETKTILSNTFDSRYDQIIGQDVYSHSIDIANNASLTVTNVTVKDTVAMRRKVGPLFDVKGKLVFEDSVLFGGKRASSDIAINILTSGQLVLTNNSSVTGYEGLYAVARSSGGAISVFDSVVASNKVSQGAAIVVGSDTLFTVGDISSVSSNTNVYEYANPVPANVQLNASRLRLASNLDAQVHITPNYAGGAREDLFGFVDFDYGDDWDNLSASASNFVNDVTSERGVVVTNSIGNAYLSWGSAINAETKSFTANGVTYHLVGELPYIPPVYIPAEPVDISFVSISKNPEGTFWQLRLVNAVAKCRYFLYQDESLEDGFVVPSDGSGSVQSLTATEDGEFMFEVPVTDKPQLFFKVLALPETVSQ
jgi:hypothetical protein